MEYQIAIPSYKRISVLNNATLATLNKLKANFDNVTVWVANEEEKAAYEKGVLYPVKIKTASPGVMAARQHYHRAYPKGTPILNLDDDVYSLKQKNGNRLGEPEMTLDEIVNLGFMLCEKTKARIWGISPVSNGFYMQDHISVGLRLICGIFFGSYAGDVEMLGERITDPKTTSAEDYELSIKSFIAHGAVVRLEFLTPPSRYFAPGGIDENLKDYGIDRKEEHLRQCELLASTYPEYCSVYMKADDRANIRLKPITHLRIPKEAI
jgi:hypothetical protein